MVEVSHDRVDGPDGRVTKRMTKGSLESEQLRVLGNIMRSIPLAVHHPANSTANLLCPLVPSSFLPILCSMEAQHMPSRAQLVLF
jgi:hypothetical protein